MREIGIRRALGAQPAGLLGMFVRDGLWLAGIGAALGLVAAAGLTPLMSSLLFGVTALDPLTYTAISALLIVAGALGIYFPCTEPLPLIQSKHWNRFAPQFAGSGGDSLELHAPTFRKTPCRYHFKFKVESGKVSSKGA
jgi:hypothetical protein